VATVKSVSLHSDNQWSNGLRKRRYLIILTDNNAVDHSFITMPLKQLPSGTGDGIAAKYLLHMSKSEVNDFIKSVRQGNTVDFQSGKWNTARNLFKPVLVEAFRSGVDDPIALNFIPYLSLVTDAQLKGLTGKPQTWVDRVRAKEVILQGIKTEQAKYLPEDMT